jgi:hypothetical protein
MSVLSNIFKPISYSDAISLPKTTKPIDWTIPATEWRETTIGKLISVGNPKNVGEMKEHEMAFYIKSNYPDVRNNTVCKVGACFIGRIIRIGEYEYRVHHRKIFRKLIGAIT